MKATFEPAPDRRILDFDTECRPMHYSDWRPESQITAIGWAWVSRPDEVHFSVLDQDLANEREMLEDFLREYDRADVVMGHYIRKHDLPLLNDHCIRLGLRPISERGGKWTIDTKLDVPQVKALGLSQDNLAELFGLANAKHHMSGAQWRVANTLSPDGRKQSIARVVGDVQQNIELYHKLVEHQALRPMRRWPR